MPLPRHPLCAAILILLASPLHAEPAVSISADTSTLDKVEVRADRERQSSDVPVTASPSYAIDEKQLEQVIIINSIASISIISNLKPSP